MRSSARILGILIALAVGLAVSFPEPAPAASARSVTTMVVVRHAEKATDDPRDPVLSPAGSERARDLAAVLDGAQVAAVYVTEFKRTRLTAEPVAQRFGVAIETVPRGTQDAAAYARVLVPKILSRRAGKAVLVVGHSDTVPAIVKLLSGREVTPIDEGEFDRLYVVEVPKSGAARLISARYGRPRP